MSKADDQKLRRRFNIKGRVQGVGFRPFVYRLAREMGLAGVVGNDVHGAFVEIEGPESAIQSFINRLRDELPPLAEISALSARGIPPQNQKEFRIESSRASGIQDAEITPDSSVCQDCLKELFDPNDRRYRYPFINCTNCGPRYSIIRGVPYDRPMTSMSEFIMCPECQAEYDNPGNRRFHAQPNACPKCGPRVWLTDAEGKHIGGDPIGKCASLFREGGIVAIKGIGGFHLTCKADDTTAVRRLRERKAREAKPFAIMVATIEEARKIAFFDAASEKAILAPSRPIVLVPKREYGICPEVAPNSEDYGIMLPYTPLHHLVLSEGTGPLVMTSGNPSEEPLCSGNDEALARLSSIADAFLMHDRGIERKVDDSVVKSYSVTSQTGEEELTIPIRRARGYVPMPLKVIRPGSHTILAVGAEMKSAVCILSGDEAVLSEHLGELVNPEAYRNFERAIDCFKMLLKREPDVLAYDMHPEYAATRYALKLDLPKTAVQHHHAHVVSCMAENGLEGKVIGVSCDGTGYGADGNIWGCEILVCDETDFERAAHLMYYPLPGGDAAARDTWRAAAGLMSAAYGVEWRAAAGTIFDHLDQEALCLVQKKLEKASGTIRTSSLGRLFDAVSFILGVCTLNRYEAEAAMTLEALAAQVPEMAPLAYDLVDSGDCVLLDWRPMIQDLIQTREDGAPTAEMAMAFHETVARMLADAVKHISKHTGLERVALSGGCFANRILLRRTYSLLASNGMEVLVHRKVPTGDGGIALGQAVVASERSRKGII